MLRIRLASVALAIGLTFTLAGCTSSSCSGPMFPRVSNLFHRSTEEGCDCQTGTLPPEFAGHGPALMTPGTMMPAVTTIPTNQPPSVVRTPSAPTFPYVPAN